MWKKLKFSQRCEKSEDGTKSPWYERYTKSPRKVRKVHGTNRPWYEKSTNGTKRLWYEKSGIQITDRFTLQSDELQKYLSC